MKEKGSTAYVALVCLVAALGGLLFGYDTGVISGAIGFLRQHFELDPAWEGWTAACALLGCVVGVSFAGPAGDRMGRKRLLVLAAILFLASSIGTAVPRTLTVFIAFRFLAGVGIGVASMASPMYIAEITPARIRGRMVSVNQLAIVSGMLAIFFVNYCIARNRDPVENADVGWRWMFASGILPSGLFLFLLFLVPESPRWLVERGRADEAFRVLARVGGEESARNELAEIQESISREDKGSMAELLQPRLRPVLWMGIALAVLQQVTGINAFLYFAPEIFKSISAAGTDASLSQTVVVGAVNMLFTVIAIWTVDRLGRKPLMLIGSAGMGASLFAMGISAQMEGTPTLLLVFILSYIACFAMSVGPVTWVILSEIFPTRVRGLGLTAATFCLWTANYFITQTFPMMDKNPWLVERFHHAFPFYIYGALCVVLVAVVWHRVPETKGKSLEEIEKMWLQTGRTPAGAAPLESER